MKKWLTLITLLFGLVSCSSQNHTEYETFKVNSENLYSFLIVKDKLYAVGEKYDYEFESELVTELSRFLKSPFAKNIKDISVELTIRDHSNVEGSYRVTLGNKDFSQSEIATLQSKFGFKIELFKPIREYQAKGKVVKLANREEILQKFRFKQPLEAKLLERTENDSLTGAELALGVVMLPVSAAVAVVGVPVLMIWAASCAHFDC